LIQIGTSKLPHGHIPLVFFNTLLTCQTQSGKTNQISVALYKPEENLQGKTKPEVILQDRHRCSDIAPTVAKRLDSV